MISVCQVVEEEIVALLSVHPGRAFEPISSLASSLGIPYLVLDSSGWISRLSSKSSTPSSIINLAPQPEIMGQVLAELVKAKSMSDGTVLVYNNENDFLMAKHFAKTLMRDGVELLEIANNQNMSEQLSLGTVLYNLIKFV